MKDKLTIGITDCSKYSNYSNWVISYADTVEVLKLGVGDFDAIKKCDGLLLTGGEDVNPRFYNKPENLEYCYADDMNEARDEFELKLLEYSQQNALPVLGICRGMQIGNVFFGGTLIPDIPSWGKPSHAKLANGNDKYHPVNIDSHSWLRRILQADEGLINSNHHQCVDKIGYGLVVSAHSLDGIAEALERSSPENSSFLCLVQWHPERMQDQQSPFVRNILNAFMEAVRTWKRKY
ncbi:gamma-glutamyl-gamma-aminobutyrate hydrolase family protein [Solitalea lacus]|uniref:gamma-glutamyl-gamma-aminobutyrate hydrolase family protein n=1 Tax=Solitalea lacus TaxID=2911172 RepID=UPI001EDA193D|nr:gamma-glutamyl-gamma-aminobutyrate hydrolase family protein [Solitalea lacus]UKJ07321.1 gamma-glutamyl-gamma-aminobutyrate hydrolase family protein [Solitalea lacus]